MNYVLIGKIVNTHGIKGELRLLSNFEKKDKALKKDIPIYIGKEKRREVINSYRPHKCFDMITLKGYNNINDVLNFKNQLVYVERESLNLNEEEYLYQDLIGLSVYETAEKLGKVTEIVYNKSNILLAIAGEINFYIPLKGNFIKKVDLKKKRIEVVNAKGLML